VRLEDFDYHLPEERIAQTPVEPRDAARLLVDRGSRPPEHRHVRDLPSLLRPGDLLVVNETKVLPARLRLQRVSGGAAEVLLLEALDPARRSWEALVRPGRKLREGEELLAPGTQHPIARVDGRAERGDTFIVTLLGATDDHLGPAAADSDDDREADGILDLLDRYGEMPLPPYIATRLADRDRYQTVYAREPGSAAAPTAGLHLTLELLDELRAGGVEIVPVELVVGLDTFRPIGTDDPLEHRMHTERYRVPAETLAACERAERVVAVGTTAVRALESAAATGRREGRTDLFIHRGFPWRIVDVLMTNFHLPRTTLLMMIDAFVGPRWRDLYEEALRGDYRFLSFGDAMLLDRGAD
jgi:S-adenosylmethionine:tRNA ribosyltransferase-isomerase